MRKAAFDFEKWRKRILEIRDARTRKENLEFCELVESVSGMSHAGVVRTLFQTFTDKPDHGVKASVFNALGAVDAQLYFQVYLEELPALVRNTSKTKWHVLLAGYPGGDLTEEKWNGVIDMIKTTPEETRKAYLDIISDDDFIADHNWTEYVLDKLQTGGPPPRSKGKKEKVSTVAPAPVDAAFDLDALLKEGEEALEEFPYDGASWHYGSDEYPEDLPPGAAFTHLGGYLGWAIERNLISDALKDQCAEMIEKFRKREILPSEIFRQCCVDEFTREHLSDRGNAFTKKYYFPGWDYYYPADFDDLSGSDISGFYMPDTWDNYERIKATIDSRYKTWLKEST